MASAPPPYTEQYQANPPVNPNYPAGGYPPQPGYPPQQPQPGYPPQQPQPGYPPAQYPPQQPQPGYPPQKPQPGYPPAQYPPQQVAAPPQPQQQGQQTIVITTQPPATGNCPICRVSQFLSFKSFIISYFVVLSIESWQITVVDLQR